MNYDKVAVGAQIRKRRIEMNLTQEQVADKIERSLRFYASIERGEVGMSVDTLMTICDCLCTTPDVLLFYTTDANENAMLKQLMKMLADCPAEKQKTAYDLLDVFLRS